MSIFFPVTSNPENFSIFLNNITSPYLSDRLVSGLMCPINPNIKETFYFAKNRIRELRDNSTKYINYPSQKTIISHLNELVFEEEQFSENPLEEIDSYSLYTVITKKKGNRLLLSILYKIICDELNIDCNIFEIKKDMFVCSVIMDNNPLIMDIGNKGRVISKEEIIELSESELDYYGKIELEESLEYDLLFYVYRHLIDLYEKEKDFEKIANIMEMQTVICPEKPQLFRDLGLLYGRIGKEKECLQYLSYYLNHFQVEDEEIEKIIIQIAKSKSSKL